MKRVVLALVFAGLAFGQIQIADRSTNTSVNPCPGGGGQLDTISVPSLDRLVLLSNLIVVGTVVSALPSFNPNPEHLDSVETDSQVSVTQTLWGNASSGTILLFQHGGKVGPCPMAVFQDDPLVKTGEQYILFLLSDNRKVPNSSGIPRYQAVGVWSGKAQIVNGKIHFLPRARTLQDKYDNMDVTSFVATLRDIIGILSEVKLLYR